MLIFTYNECRVGCLSGHINDALWRHHFKRPKHGLLELATQDVKGAWNILKLANLHKNWANIRKWTYKNLYQKENPLWHCVLGLNISFLVTKRECWDLTHRENTWIIKKTNAVPVNQIPFLHQICLA